MNEHIINHIGINFRRNLVFCLKCVTEIRIPWEKRHRGVPLSTLISNSCPSSHFAHVRYNFESFNVLKSSICTHFTNTIETNNYDVSILAHHILLAKWKQRSCYEIAASSWLVMFCRLLLRHKCIFGAFHSIHHNLSCGVS